MQIAGGLLIAAGIVCLAFSEAEDTEQAAVRAAEGP